MAKPPQDITEAELSVLQALWSESPATIRRLADLLYPGGGAAQYATVQKLLERLEAKDCVTRDRGSGGAHTFSPAVDRDELIGRRLRVLAEKLCGGSVTPLLTHLVKTEPLSAQDRKALRDLIDQLDRNGKTGKKRD